MSEVTKSQYAEFTVVKHKKKSGKKHNSTNSPFSGDPTNFPDIDIDKVKALRRIESAKIDFVTSDYYKSFLITLKESLKVLEPCQLKEILCLGLGHIGECTISRYQLALILCLREQFNLECHVHDPVFYTSECEVLKSLDFTLIKDNKEGKYSLHQDKVTIVFLPHCPKQLTNNFLWHNWGNNLKNCVLICNSFLSLIESQPIQELNISAPYLLNIAPYVEEFSLVNSFKFNDIFNDLSIHIFPEKTLSLITNNFWSKSAEDPEYKDETEYIRASLVDRLKIF